MWELECSSQRRDLKEGLNQEKVVTLSLGTFLKFSVAELWMNHVGHVLFATQCFRSFTGKTSTMSSMC